MFDSVCFQKNIIGIMTMVCDYQYGVIGKREPTKTKKTGYSTFKIMDDKYPVELIYQNHDLYLQGWRNQSQQLFIHKNSGYDMRADQKFKFGNDYGELGFDRSAPGRINLAALHGALGNAWHARVSGGPDHEHKRTFALLAVGFSEAVRFTDVMLQIIHDEPITDLDWDKHKNTWAVQVAKG